MCIFAFEYYRNIHNCKTYTTMKHLTLWRNFFMIAVAIYTTATPPQLIADERTQANIKKNAVEWETFIKYLESKGKLRK